MPIPLGRIFSWEMRTTQLSAPTREESDSIRRVNLVTHLLSLGCCVIGSQLTEHSIVWLVPSVFLLGNYFMLDALVRHLEERSVNYLHLQDETILL